MNTIFIMSDTFRRDHLGCYGNSWIHTPSLDRFAQHAAIFDQFYAASYPTVPNRWDILNGRFGFPFRGWQPLAPDDETLAQFLSKERVHTQMIWDTPMLGLHNYDYTRGFKGIEYVRGQKGDTWDTNPTYSIRMPGQPHKIRSASSLEGYLRNHFHRRYEREYCVGRTISAAMDWLETNHRQRSFFLYVDMWDPHEPFDCPWYDYARYADPAYTGDQMLYPEYGRSTYMTDDERENARALYAGQVTLVDRWMGYFFDLIEKLGLLQNTLVIWTTDHGHLFGEHDLQGKPGAELGTLYEVTTRIPLLIHHPEEWGAGKRVNGIVQPPDLMPSILEFMGITVPAHVQGRSLWPLVMGEESLAHQYAFTSRFPPTAGDASYVPVEGAVFDGWVGPGRIVEPSTVTDSTWAYLAAPLGRPSELYHLPSDPQQKHNVIAEYADVAKGMHKAWVEFLESHGASPSRIQPFQQAGVEAHTPLSGKLYAFREDGGRWIACATEREARQLAYRSDAPGPLRSIEEVTFGAILDDHPKNLIHLFGQYYWAEDLE